MTPDAKGAGIGIGLVLGLVLLIWLASGFFIVQEGQQVEVLVLSCDAEHQRISLSLKALEARPSPAAKEPELPEPEAANRWFAYAESHGIDIPKAISIWEDAATVSGNESRRLVREAGITIETP